MLYEEKDILWLYNGNIHLLWVTFSSEQQISNNSKEKPDE